MAQPPHSCETGGLYLMLRAMELSVAHRYTTRELGDLRHDLLATAPLLTYLRYNVELSKATLTSLNMTLSDQKIENLSAMDDPDNMALLQQIGALAAKQRVRAEDFPSHFDLVA
jgi:uncharacterized protein